MSSDQAEESLEKQKAEAMTQTMKFVVDFNGSQLKELRRFVDLLLQIRYQQGRADED